MRSGSAALLMAVLAAASAAAAPRMEVEPFLEVWRQGDIASLRVEIENDGPATSVTLVAGHLDLPERPRTEQRLELPAGARKAFAIAVQPTIPTLELRLEQGETLLQRETLVLPSMAWSHDLIAVVGDPPARLRAELEGGRGQRTRARVVETRLELLPDDFRLWPSVDQFVWPAPRSHELSARQAEALRDWVVSGGRLVAGTHREEPLALQELGLLDAGAASGDHALGWGRVTLVGGDLSRDPAPTWLGLLAVQEQPPSARTAGPDRLVRRALARVERSVDAPVGLSGLVLFLAAVALAAPPWIRATQARQGRPTAVSALGSGPALMACATLATFAIAHFGAGSGLVVDRLDLVDVDAVTGDVRARSYLAVRRARGASLRLDTGAQGRLRALDVPGSHRGRDRQRSAIVLAADGRSASVETLSWEPVLLEARWAPRALERPALDARPAELSARLGAVASALRVDGVDEWVVEVEKLPQNLLDSGASVVLGRWGRGQEERSIRSLRALVELRLEALRPAQQWSWPASERWRPAAGERVLVALTARAEAPPVLLDGEQLPGPALTLWRVRLPREDGGDS